MSTRTAEELAELFATGRYEELATELVALRPDLDDTEAALEVALAATKVLSEYVAKLRVAAEKAVAEIDRALLVDPAPLAAYADARDVLRAALGAREATS